MFRSLWSEILKMGNQSEINIVREAEQSKNLLLQLLKRSQPSDRLSLLVFADHQTQAFKGIQHQLSGWACRCARRLSCIQAFDLTLALDVGFGQFPSDYKLHQAQQPQADDQQMDQSGDVQINLQKQRHQAKQATFESAKPLLNCVLPAVSQDRSSQRQLASVVIGRIEAPAQLLPSFEKTFLVEFDFYFMPMFTLSSPWAILPRSHFTLFGRRLEVPVDDSFNSSAL